MSNPTPIMLHGCGHIHIQNTGIPALSLAAPQGRYWKGFLGEEERISFKPLKWEPGRKYQVSISIYIFYVLCVSVCPDLSTDTGTWKAPNTFYEISR